MGGCPALEKEMVQDVASADHSELRNNLGLDSLLARISETVGPVRCELWFGEPGTVVWDEAGVQFRFESEFSMNRVTRQYGAQLRQAVESLAGESTVVRFVVYTGSAPGAGQGSSDRANQVQVAPPSGLVEPQVVKPGEQLLPATTANGVRPSLEPGYSNGFAGVGETDAAAVSAVRFDERLDRDDPVSHIAPIPGINGVRARVQAAEAQGNRAGKTEREPIGSSPRASSLRRGHTLESFWFGPENQLLETAIRENARGTGHFSPLLIYGPTGSGKTHLLEAICRRFRAAHSQRRCVCLTAEEFLNEFVSCLKKSGLPMFRRKFRDLDLLAIDDVHFLAGKTATVNELNVTLGQLIREGKQVILTTDRQPMELSQLSQELTARLHGGLNCPLRYPGIEGRRRILETICEQRGWSFAPDVLELIALGIEQDCRRLAGALNRLRAAELASGLVATRESAGRDLCDLMSVGDAVTTLPRIEKLVCEACGIPPAQLRSDSRTKRISSARMLAMWLSRRHTSNALSEIGDYFGGRSHSTVVAAEKRVEQWLEAGGKIELEGGVVPVSDALQLLARRLRVG